METSATESGFINSQPSMVEFMTSLPLLDDVGDVIRAHSAALAHSATPTDEDLVSMTSYYEHPLDLNSMAITGSSSSGDTGSFAWMKDKKSVRKSNQHGNWLTVPIPIPFHLAQYLFSYSIFGKFIHTI